MNLVTEYLWDIVGLIYGKLLLLFGSDMKLQSLLPEDR